MKTPILTAAAFLSVAFSGGAQSYTIDWHKIAAGGGATTGGVYSLSGTIGQHDAGAMSGGSYSLTGGFWSLADLPAPGAPPLAIALTSTNTVLVSWPSPSTGFALQQSIALSSTIWTTPAEAITDDGTNKFIIVHPPSGDRFYRLLKP